MEAIVFQIQDGHHKCCQSGTELTIHDGGIGLDTLSSGETWKLGPRFPQEFVLGEKIAHRYVK